MAKRKKLSPNQALQAAAGRTHKGKYVLRLYVAGITPRSSQAIRSVTALCETHLAGRFDLQIVDIYQQPKLIKGEQIIAAPTLIKKLPLPLRRLIGNMASQDKLLVGLDLQSTGLVGKQSFRTHDPEG
jgi:circadian clock protein KaiB